MRIAVMGAGAVGGYFGGLLSRAGHAVTALDASLAPGMSSWHSMRGSRRACRHDATYVARAGCAVMTLHGWHTSAIPA